MPTLRLFMENFLTKNYPGQSYSYYGDLAKIRNENTMKIYHPYYHINFKDKQTICIVGIEPNIIVYLCREGIKKIQDFETFFNSRKFSKISRGPKGVQKGIN